MVEYIESGKRAIFGGLVFVRDDETGYYLNSTLSIRLHRAVYEAVHGPIPDGFHVHHIDFDKSNNEPSNLIALSKEDHHKLHGENLTQEQLEKLRSNIIERAIPKAREWHKSNAGREWHRRHYEEIKDAFQRNAQFRCQYCGNEYASRDNGCSKFCSNACKSAFRRASGIDNEIRVCHMCGGEFLANKYSDTACCSRSCANRLRSAVRKGETRSEYRDCPAGV